MAGAPVFEAQYSPMRSLLLGLMSIGFVALGLWLAGFIGEPPTGSRRLPDWAVPILGWLAIVCFAPFAAMHLMKVFNPGVSVRVDEQGMLISDYCAETIAWNEFTALRTQNIMGTQLLQFEVIPEREATFGAFRKLLMPLNRSTSGMGGSLVVNNTNRSFNELIEAVRTHAPPQLNDYLR